MARIKKIQPGSSTAKELSALIRIKHLEAEIFDQLAVQSISSGSESISVRLMGQVSDSSKDLQSTVSREGPSGYYATLYLCLEVM